MAWKRIHFVTFQIIQLALCEPKCPESFPFLIEYAKSFTLPTGSSIHIRPLVQFLRFFAPFQKNLKTNDTFIERTNKELLDS